jgi:hypothetical protein
VRWVKSSPWSIRAVDAPFAVSKALVLDLETGELVEKFSAWRVNDPEPGERHKPMPTMLGVFLTAAEAKARCHGPV